MVYCKVKHNFYSILKYNHIKRKIGQEDLCLLSYLVLFSIYFFLLLFPQLCLWIYSRCICIDGRPVRPLCLYRLGSASYPIRLCLPLAFQACRSRIEQLRFAIKWSHFLPLIYILTYYFKLRIAGYEPYLLTMLIV